MVLSIQFNAYRILTPGWKAAVGVMGSFIQFMTAKIIKQSFCFVLFFYQEPYFKVHNLWKQSHDNFSHNSDG